MSRTVYISSSDVDVISLAGRVGLVFSVDAAVLGLDRDARLGIELTPQEAHRLAQTLQEMAASASKSGALSDRGSLVGPGPETPQ